MSYLYRHSRGPLCQPGTLFYSCASFRGCCTINPCKEKRECPRESPRAALGMGEPNVTAFFSQSPPPNTYVLPLVWSPLDAVSGSPFVPAISATPSRHPTISSSTPPTTGTPSPTPAPHLSRKAGMTPGALTATIGSFTIALLLFIFMVALLQDPTRRKRKRKQHQAANNTNNWSTDSETLVASGQVPLNQDPGYELDYFTRSLPPTPNNSLAQASSNESSRPLHDSYV